ncbi:MAG TPA: DNA-binding response regulator [Firmicutes bacterium]|nr:DNA-binding response regulator [Bacillota bacterium]
MILLIEDNDNIISGLEYFFKKEGYDFASCKTIKSAKYFLERNTPDIIVLDISLPDGKGTELFEKVIKEKNIPTIVLTAYSEEDGVVDCLGLGCEDYMTKPFSTKELLARIKRILLRSNKSSIIKSHGVEFDLDKMAATKDGVDIALTGLELKILNLLFSNVNKVVKRSTILDKIWEWTGNDVDDHTVTVYLKRIREKIGDEVIETIKRVGYRIDGE